MASDVGEWLERVFLVVIFALYLIVFFFSFSLFLWSFWRTRCSFFIVSTTRFFHTLLFPFFVLRLTWILFILFDTSDIVSFLLNRAAFLFFITAFLVVLFSWAEEAHRTYIDDVSILRESFLPRLRWFFLALVLLLGATQVVLLAVWVGISYVKHDGSNKAFEGDPLYEANVLFDAAVYIVISVAFLFYTYLQTVVLSAMECSKSCFGGITSGMLFTGCFSCRFVMLLVAYLMQDSAAANSFWFLVLHLIFVYVLPEVIPAVLQMVLVHRRQTKAMLENEQISKLYEEESSDSGGESVSTSLRPRLDTVYIDEHLSSDNLKAPPYKF